MCDLGLNNLDLWHHKLAHLNNRNMKLIVQHKLVEGLPKATKSKMKFCEGFAIWQVDGIPRAADVLGPIHLNIWGLAKTPSFSGARYFIIFIDDFSRKKFVSFLCSKKECFTKFCESKNFVEMQTRKKLKVFRIGNGKEDCSCEFQDFFKAHGISHQTSTIYTS